MTRGISEVSGRIVGEVFKYAPTDLTSAELLVYIRLAENAPERTRIARFTTAENIADDTRLSYGTVRNALSELARRGLIVRQYDHARLGRAQDYQLTKLAEHHRNCTRRECHSTVTQSGPDSVTPQ